MRTTVNLDDEVMAKAGKLFGDMKTGELVNRALGEMVTREAAKRLAGLGGMDPEASAPARRSVSFVAEESAPYTFQKTS